MQLDIQNPNLSKNNTSQISGLTLVGSVNIPVYDSLTFSQGMFVVLSEGGTNNAELKTVQDVPADQTYIVTNATAKIHGQGDPITMSPYDQIYITKNGSSYETIQIDWSGPNNKTVWTDGANVSTDQYTIQYFNSSTGKYSPATTSFTISGYPNCCQYNIRKIVRRILKDPNRINYADEELNDYINDSYAELHKVVLGVDDSFVNTTINFNLYDTVQEYDLPVTVRDITSVRIALNGSTQPINAYPLSKRQVYDNQYNNFPYENTLYSAQNNTLNFFWYLNGNKIGLWPIPQTTGQIFIDYFPAAIQFLNDFDVPYNALIDSRLYFIDGALAMAYRRGTLDDFGERGGTYVELFEADKKTLTEYLTNRQSQLPKLMQDYNTGHLDPALENRRQANLLGLS